MGEKRRDKGEGGISPRSDGRYAVSYKKHNTTVKTMKQAKEKLNEWKAKEARGEPLAVKRQTVKTYIGNYIVNYKQHSLKPKSYERIMQTYNNQVVPHIGDIQMGALSTDHIQQMINNIYSELSYSTAKVLQYIQVMLSAYRIEINVNPTNCVIFASNKKQLP